MHQSNDNNSNSNNDNDDDHDDDDDSISTLDDIDQKIYFTLSSDWHCATATSCIYHFDAKQTHEH